MTHGATTNRVGRIHLVCVPVTDHDRAIAFYESLGFEKRADAEMVNGDRWVEVYPPDGAAGIALAPGNDEVSGVQTGILLTTDDIDATHAELRAAGVDVDDEIGRPGNDVTKTIGASAITGPTPPMFYFRDPDGNSLLMIGP